MDVSVERSTEIILSRISLVELTKSGLLSFIIISSPNSAAIMSCSSYSLNLASCICVAVCLIASCRS